MIRHVGSPDGASWTVRRLEAPWRLRLRGGFDLDPVGILLGFGACLILVAESVPWALGWGIQRLRHAFGLPWKVEARTAGPPDRSLHWSVAGATASAALLAEIAAGLAEGRDVASTATTRVVGERGLRG